MPTKTRFSLVLGLLLAGLLSVALAACGNDDDDAEPTQPATPTADADGADDTATGDSDDDTVPSTPGSDDSADDAGGEDPRDAIRRAADAERQTMSVTYQMEFEDELMTITMHSDPPRYAFAMSGTMEGIEGSFITIYDGKDSYLCTSDASEEMCMKFEGEGANDFFGDDLFFFFDREAMLDEIAADGEVTLRPAPGRNIAGHSADCWDVSGDAGEEGIVCISNEQDILLLIDGTFEGESFRMEVVDVQDRPSDSDFEPPYEVIDLGAALD